jgi:hypothetical protein
MKSLLFWVLLIVGTLLNAQQVTGVVIDRVTGAALPGALVQLATGVGAQTDDNGEFIISGLASGRYQITISFLGYQSFVKKDLVLKGLSSTQLEIALDPVPQFLEGVTVRSSQDFQVPGRRVITQDQIYRFSSTYYDPARLVSTSPDLNLTNDQNNQISVRGLSPALNVWRLEGVEVVNPNHLSNSGTLSDQPTQSGGGVNMISAQLLSSSEFNFGPMNASKSNAAAGLFEINLREGAQDDFFFGVQASLIGFDFLAEGPLGKSKKTSFLANYRYSFTGLLGNLGVDFGGETIGFQDLNIITNTRLDNGGSLKLFVMGGSSYNRFKHTDFVDVQRQKDQKDIDFESQIAIAGISWRQKGWKVAFAQSIADESWSSVSYGSAGKLDETFRQIKNPVGISSASISKGVKWSRGLIDFDAGFNQYRIEQSVAFALQQGVDDTFSRKLAHAGVTASSFFSKRLKLELSSKILTDGDDIQVDPRIRVDGFFGKFLPYVAIGRYSQLLNPFNNSFDSPLANVGYQPVEEFGFIYSDRIISGLDYQTSNWKWNIELFHYELSRDHISTDDPGSYTRGLSMTTQNLQTSRWYFLGGGTIFDSKLMDGNIESPFNSQYVINASFGTQWESRKNEQAKWDINIRTSYQGGNWYSNRFTENPISSVESFEQSQLDDFFRVDFRIQRVFEKEKSTRYLSIDIQNMLNRENQSFPFYDEFLNEEAFSTQLGLVPILTYRIAF